MGLRFQRFINGRRVPAGFAIHRAKMAPEAWPDEQPAINLNYMQNINESQRNHYKGDFEHRIKEAIATGKCLQLYIDDNFPSKAINSFGNGNRIARIDIQSNNAQKLNFQSTDILKIHVGGPAPRHNLVFERCHIQELSINDGQQILLELKDTWISTLNIKKGGIRHLEINGGGILSIVVQSGDSNNPFTGPVVIRDVYLPREPGTGMTAQRLRDVRSHLLKMNNVLAAGKFHSAELALDRPIESIPNKCFSWLYEIMADFGNSPSRPLKSLLFFFVLMTGLGFFGDVIREPEALEAIGWREALIGNENEQKLLRSVAYSISSILNPLGILNSKPLLVSKSPYWTAALAFISLGGTLSIIFLLIAIRRRFKLE